jgi:hypothetical protein
MIPKEIITEDGRKPMTPAWLAARLAEGRFEDSATPSPHEVCSMLGLVGDGWMELLKCGFPYPSTVAQVREWFQKEGWLE